MVFKGRSRLQSNAAPSVHHTAIGDEQSPNGAPARVQSEATNPATKLL
jgi:hypothetical protein